MSRVMSFAWTHRHTIGLIAGVIGAGAGVALGYLQGQSAPETSVQTIIFAVIAAAAGYYEKHKD